MREHYEHKVKVIDEKELNNKETTLPLKQNMSDLKIC